MSINRNRQEPSCLCCGKKRPQKFSNFCEDCWNDNPDGCRKAIGMVEYSERYPDPRRPRKGATYAS
jgi:hypothetical protein